jgi:hypothetical protein
MRLSRRSNVEIFSKRSHTQTHTQACASKLADALWIGIRFPPLTEQIKDPKQTRPGLVTSVQLRLINESWAGS